jgi:threonine dehydrogenase-like Zn-dependent dehydrogenase
MARTMKAMVVEKPKKMVLKEIPVPEIGGDEVLIKVKYTGICGTDWSIYTGKYSADKLPLVPGHEFSGVIAKAGKGARGIEEGDRVTADINMSCGRCFYCRRGLRLNCPEFSQLGIHMDGTYAEYVKAPWSHVHKLHEKISFMQGAFVEPVSCVIHSAKAMKVEIGSSVAILGDRLGIIHAALAKYRGAAPVIVMGINDKRLGFAKAMGADFIFNVNRIGDPVGEVKKLTGGRGADFVVEAVGTPKTYEQAFAMTRPGGTLAAFGITGAEDLMSIRPFEIVLGERKISGSCAGFDNDWNDAIALLQYGRIVPDMLFSLLIPLEELEQALNEIQTNLDLMKVFVSPEATKREVLG